MSITSYNVVPSGPAKRAEEVTPHDTNRLSSVTRGLYVGNTGDVSVITGGGDQVTFANVQAGTTLPICVTIVRSTGTTATDMVALY